MRSVTLILLLCLGVAGSWAQQMNLYDRGIIKAFRSSLKNPEVFPFVNCDNYLFFCSPSGRVKTIYLAGLKMDGYISADFAKIPELENIFLHRNQLKGNIPASFANLKKLKVLSLFENSLSGSLPAFLNTMPNLMMIDVSYNYFWGSPPIDASKLPKLTKLNLAYNYFYKVTPQRGLPTCDMLKSNCVLVAPHPKSCPASVVEMRSFKVCNGFCAASQIGGVCAGHGDCIISTSGKFKCKCFPGYNNKKKKFTCMRN